MWKDGINSPGRVIDDFVSFIDFAPTFIELAGLKWDQTGMATTPGRSMTGIFMAGNDTRQPLRDHVIFGKERHDVGRPFDQGYPIRGIIRDGYLYLRNFEPSRWPAGNPETGYLNSDGSPTKTLILDMRRQGKELNYWSMNFGKRPGEELYCIADDPMCMVDLSGKEEFFALKEDMKKMLFQELSEQEDPRMFGRGDIFLEYEYADVKTKDFYNRFMAGEPVQAGWVEKTDFETEPIEE